MITWIYDFLSDNDVTFRDKDNVRSRIDIPRAVWDALGQPNRIIAE